jgi:hypothetical protein
VRSAAATTFSVYDLAVAAVAAFDGIAAALCLAASWRARQQSLASPDPVGAARLRLLARFWFGVALGLVILGVARALDLQRVTTDAIRRAAQSEGWYAGRRPLQALLVLLTVGAVAVAAVAIRRLLRPVMARLRWALVGLAVVATCVAVREISFHYTDVMLSGGPHVGWLLELAGVACVAVAARQSVLESTCRI